MEFKCLDQYTSSLILATLSLAACIVRAEFLISVLDDLKQPNSTVDPNIIILLMLNAVLYLILGVFCILLIFAIIKKRHWLMLPWLLTAVVSVICEVIFVAYILANGHSIYALYILIGTGLGLWIIWVMFSLFKATRQECRRESLESIQGYRFNRAKSEEIY